MTLSKAQLKARQKYLGASEASAVLGIDKHKTELDVWVTKCRGPGLKLPPISNSEQPDRDSPKAFSMGVERAHVTTAGNILEAGIVKLYEYQTGYHAYKAPTRVHPNGWASATPDRYVGIALGQGGGPERIRRGLECKLVGHYMADDWASDSLPERVWVQCQWGMAVLGFPEWDCAALIDGTSFVVHHVQRDDEFLKDALEACGEWWERHVVGDVAPEPRNAQDRSRFTKRKHPGDNGETLNLNESPELLRQVEPLVSRLLEVTAQKKALEEQEFEAKAQLESLCGPYRGMRLDRGLFSFPSVASQPKWKEVAHLVNKGPVPAAILAKSTGKPHRKSHFYPKKA